MRNTVICISLRQALLLCSLFTLSLSVRAVTPRGVEGQEIEQPFSSSSVLDSARTDKHISRFIVSFSSICCGINTKKRDEFIKFVRNYKGTPSYTTYNWGEEGEIDYCFSLKELTEEEQKTFIKKAQKVLGKERSIRTYENIGCPR